MAISVPTMPSAARLRQPFSDELDIESLPASRVSGVRMTSDAVMVPSSAFFSSRVSQTASLLRKKSTLVRDYWKHIANAVHHFFAPELGLPKRQYGGFLEYARAVYLHFEAKQSPAQAEQREELHRTKEKLDELRKVTDPSEEQKKRIMELRQSIPAQAFSVDSYEEASKCRIGALPGSIETSIGYESADLPMMVTLLCWRTNRDYRIEPVATYESDTEAAEIFSRIRSRWDAIGPWQRHLPFMKATITETKIRRPMRNGQHFEAAIREDNRVVSRVESWVEEFERLEEDEVPDDCTCSIGYSCLRCTWESWKHYLRGKERLMDLDIAFNSPRQAADDLCEGGLLKSLLYMECQKAVVMMKDLTSKAPFRNPLYRTCYLVSLEYCYPQTVSGWLATIVLLLALAVVLWKLTTKLSDHIIGSGNLTMTFMAMVVSSLATQYYARDTKKKDTDSTPKQKSQSRG